jgi:GntR family transcriptional regulator
MAVPFTFRLDHRTGVPVYRQIIDQVLVAISSRVLNGGDQLPTVRQVAVDLAINPNTVVRAYRELEIRGVLTTQQGTGTFITPGKVEPDQALREKRLSQLISEIAARAGAEGFSVSELVGRLKELVAETDHGR